MIRHRTTIRQNMALYPKIDSDAAFFIVFTTEKINGRADPDFFSDCYGCQRLGRELVTGGEIFTARTDAVPPAAPGRSGKTPSYNCPALW